MTTMLLTNTSGDHLAGGFFTNNGLHPNYVAWINANGRYKHGALRVGQIVFIIGEDGESIVPYRLINVSKGTNEGVDMHNGIGDIRIRLGAPPDAVGRVDELICRA